MNSIADTLADAKAYASLGWLLIPCHSPKDGGCSCHKGSDCPKPGKHPRIREWQNFASADLNIIEAWLCQWPEANLGVRLGPCSGVVDIEFDSAIGEATAEELLSHLRTPRYRSHRSTHTLFAFPHGLTPGKAVANWRGLEIRLGTGERGALSILPPSLHASGERYRWLSHPSEVGLAEAPAWLGEALEGDRPAVECEEPSLVFSMRGEAELLERHAGEAEGNRHRKLCELVGRHLGLRGPDAELPGLALTWARRCSPPLPEGEVISTVARLSQKEQGKPTRSNGKKQVGGGASLSPLVSSPARAVQYRRFRDIEPESVSWLWSSRLPLGKLSLIAGEPGLGKTFAAIDVAARVSRGLPFCDGAQPEQGEVAIITAEDGVADTLAPRLRAAEADLSRVLVIDGVGVGKDYFSLSRDIAPLEALFTSRPELRLLVLDPISAFLGERVDANENASVRRVLGPLAELADRHRVALLGITHLTKAETKAINRVLGSIAFVAAARAVWLVAQDEEEAERRLFLPVKNNLARCSGLSFRVDDDPPRCVWSSEPIAIAADDIGHADDSPLEEALRWLKARLSTPMPAKWLYAQSKADGISERTLRRAKKVLRLESNKVGEAWVWSLPGQEPEPAGEGVWLVE